MKKFLFLFFSFSVSQSVFAQKLGVGVRANVHFASQSLPADVANSLSSFGGLQNIIGIGIAVPIEISLTDMFSIQPEIMYLQKGAKLAIDVAGVAKIDASQKLNYLEVPVLLKVNFLKDAPLGISLLAGPSFGYALSGTNVVTASGSSIPATNQTTDEDFKDFARFELGLHGGINLGFALGSGKIILDARYLFGLSNLSSSANTSVSIPGTTPTTSTTNDKITNRGYSIGLGYMIYF